MGLRRFKKSASIAAGICVLTLLVSFAGAQQEEEYSYKYHGKRDPFLPLISPSGYLLNLEPEENSALLLEGILYDPEGDSIAIINGELIRVGEAIAGSVLTSIKPNKITVIKDNEKIEIELRREE